MTINTLRGDPMQIENTKRFMLSPMKEPYEYEAEQNGIIIENESHIVYIYATDASHEKIYCAIPVCSFDCVRKKFVTLKAINEKILISMGDFRIIIDFKEHNCSCNVQGLTVYGSSHWGENVSLPWKDEFYTLFDDSNSVI